MTAFRIGTRTSKLALAQATLVKNTLQKQNSDLDVAIVEIETKADATQTPIDVLPNGAFCQELDQALLDGDIDCAVHSFKDRGNRPSGITTAAITERANPRDIAIFSHAILDKLKNGKTLTLGVSTERRAIHAVQFLQKALPNLNVDIKTTLIRGTIENRLRRLNKDCDAIVLAVAGLSRLSDDVEIQALLDDRRFMMLPLSECPTAAGQGALALDCRENDDAIKKILAGLHDKKTAKHIARETLTLQHCSPAAGATSISAKHFPDHILFVKDKGISAISWEGTAKTLQGNFWDGTQKRSEVAKTSYFRVDPKDIDAEAVFVTHSRAAHPDLIAPLKTKTVWTSGVHSWFRLAKQGIWVQGCTEELGHDILRETLHTAPFLNLPAFNTWQVLTHDQSSNEWHASQVLATYTVNDTFDIEAANELARAKHVFWSSVSQFNLYKDYIANDAWHYCRAGKTADTLKSYDLSLTVFPNSEMWRQCLTKHS